VRWKCFGWRTPVCPFPAELPSVVPIDYLPFCRLCAALKPAFGEHAPPMERMAGSDLREMLQLPGLAAHPAVARALAASLDAGPAWPQVPPGLIPYGAAVLLLQVLRRMPVGVLRPMSLHTHTWRQVPEW
jgi:hypothetical protein